MKPKWVSPADKPGSITDKQKLTMSRMGLVHTDTTTSREAAKAIAYAARQAKKEVGPSKRRGKKRKGKSRDLAAFARQLNNNLPKSEIWFQELYEPYKVQGDEFNVPFGGYIPDLINKEHRYIIEVDGTMHDQIHIQMKDRVKDKQRERLNYLCVRIKAYDKASFEEAMLKINSRRYEGTGLPVTKLSEEEYRLKLEEEARSISERANVERKTNH